MYYIEQKCFKHEPDILSTLREEKGEGFFEQYDFYAAIKTPGTRVGLLGCDGPDSELSAFRRTQARR